MSVRSSRLELRIDQETKDRWNAARGGKSLSQFVIDSVNDVIAGKDETVKFLSALPSTKVTTRPSSDVKKVKFDSSCTNRQYHWKGPCKFCGGS